MQNHRCEREHMKIKAKKRKRKTKKNKGRLEQNSLDDFYM